MSGKRTKALRRKFRELYGRAPNRAVVELAYDGGRHPKTLRLTNWFRRLREKVALKKQTVLVASEWRRFKREQRRTA